MAAVDRAADTRNETERVKPEVAARVADLTNSKVQRAVHEGKKVGDGVWVGYGVNVGDPENVFVGLKLPVALKLSVPCAVPLYPNTEENAGRSVSRTGDRHQLDDPEKVSDTDNPNVGPQTDCVNGRVAKTSDDADPTSVTRTHDEPDSGGDGENTSLAVNVAERGRDAVTGRRPVTGSDSDFAPMLDPRSGADGVNVPETVSELEAAKKGVFEWDSVGDGDCVGDGHGVPAGVSDGDLLVVGDGDCDSVGDGDCDRDPVADGDWERVCDGDFVRVSDGDRDEVRDGDWLSVFVGDRDCVADGDWVPVREGDPDRVPEGDCESVVEGRGDWERVFEGDCERLTVGTGDWERLLDGDCERLNVGGAEWDRVRKGD